jgi:hypothetical protein
MRFQNPANGYEEEVSVTSGLFLILMAQLSGAPWGKSLLASIVLPIFFWLVFVKLLQVSLPAGSLFVRLFGS